MLIQRSTPSIPSPAKKTPTKTDTDPLSFRSDYPPFIIPFRSAVNRCGDETLEMRVTCMLLHSTVLKREKLLALSGKAGLPNKIKNNNNNNNLKRSTIEVAHPH